ncbi:MAG: helix-turn-helix domain-containing protein [Oscillospiraceae bacterium]|nr:helix-turn-helix domain-containing protein [Oscillospiraceae bacterium]
MNHNTQNAIESIISSFEPFAEGAFGVADDKFNIVAATDGGFLVGERLPVILPEGAVVFKDNGYIVRKIEGKQRGRPLFVFYRSTEQAAESVVGIAAAALETMLPQEAKKSDKASFLRSVLLENILPGDIYLYSGELDLEFDKSRMIILFRDLDIGSGNVYKLLRDKLEDEKDCYVVSASVDEVAVVYELPSSSEGRADRDEKLPFLERARAAAEKLSKYIAEAGLEVEVGIGRRSTSLRNLADRYTEAQFAIDVGKVFTPEEKIVTYEQLGIGRLVYQLPTKLCELFLSEIFTTGKLSDLDKDTIETVETFFKNNLNLSEASRNMFIHRNTLVYRLNRIRRITGLDLRDFDDAVIFKIAMMVYKYLNKR